MTARSALVSGRRRRRQDVVAVVGIRDAARDLGVVDQDRALRHVGVDLDDDRDRGRAADRRASRGCTSAAWPDRPARHPTGTSPTVGVALTKLTRAGSESVTTTFGATDGPALETLIT